jgi:hypothetical protein
MPGPIIKAPKDTDGRGPFRDQPKDTDGRGGGGSSLPSGAEDIFARASQLGGLLVVAFISPVGGGGSPRAAQPISNAFAGLGQLADRRDRADGFQTREVIQGQGQKIGALATQVTQVAEHANGLRDVIEKQLQAVKAPGAPSAGYTSEVTTPRPEPARKK